MSQHGIKNRESCYCNLSPRRFTTRKRIISEFQTPTFKTKLSAKTFLTENEFYLHENKNYNFHINGVALSLALKQRLEATRNGLSLLLNIMLTHVISSYTNF